MSAGWFDNASCLSLYKMNEHQFLNTPPQVDVDKQGITSILTSDFNSNSHNQIVLPFHNSIRRTLSADMSSPKWLQNNGFPHSSVKRVKSSLQLQPLLLGKQPTTLCHDDDDHDNNKGPAFEEIWSSIQAHKNSWGCILSSGSGAGQEVSPPYVHPLAKRSGSSLSEKSLEICTESLGSETGSDGFSYPPSDSDEEQEEEEEEEEQLLKEYNVQQVGVGINNRGVGVGVGPTSKRAPPTRPSFPPPLPSLGHRDDGSNLHIRSHRQDGRLVVEAVSVPSQNCFRVRRQDGRLLLTFCPTHDDQPQNHDEDEDEDGDDTNNNNVQVIQQQEEEEEKGGVMEVQVQRSCTPLTMMSKFVELTNKSSTWPRNYNTSVIKTLKHEEQHTVDDDDDDVVPLLPMTLTKSLPPRPTKSTTTASAALNAYEYYWRRSNSTAVGMLNPLAHANANANANANPNANANANNNKKSVGKHTKRNNRLLYAAHTVKKGGGGGAADEYAVPLMLRGCKEAKKPSLLLWEPYCIATS